jgi:hypothetical protein
MDFAVVKMLEWSKRRIGEKKVGICLMMRLLDGVNGSLMNFLDLMRKRRGRKGGPLLVSYESALGQEIAYLQTSGKELGARD